MAELVQGGALLQDDAMICEVWTASKATKARTPEQAVPAITVHQVTSGLRLRNATVSQRRRIRLMGVRGRWILIFVVLTLNGPTFSQVYKWVDQAGVTHYGSAPPTGARATLVQPAASVNPAAASSAPEPAHQAGKGLPPAGRDADGRVREGSDPIEWKQAEAERLRHCAFARQQLDVLTLGGPVFRRDTRGGRQYLPDEAREGEIARMRAEVARQCSGLDSDAATQSRWRQMNNFVLCDRARSLLQAHDANRSRVSNQEYEKVTSLVEESCAPGRFPAETGQRGEWFRQYILPGEMRQ